MKTIITNVCGKTRFFGFLPPHGRTLTANQAVTFDGDLRTVLASGRNRFSGARAIKSLNAAEAGLDIEYVAVQPAAEQSSSSLTA
jgi:hypothetical protein